MYEAPGHARRAAGLSLLALVIVATLSGSASGQNAPAAGSATASSEIEGQPRNPDPWEKMNRGTFAFNEWADIYVLTPVARGWRYVTPELLHTGIRNFNGLILMPTTFFNNVLQLNPGHAAEDVGRVLVNATLGIAGLIDVDTLMGIPENDEDFGQTLGYWGAPPGPYLVLPLFGPSSIRGGIGRLGDGAGTFYFTWLPVWSTFLVRGVDLISWRSDHIEDVDLSRRESLDFYVFQRDAYLQLSQNRVDQALGIPSATEREEDDLYFFDDDDDDDHEEEDEADDDEVFEGDIPPAEGEPNGG